MVSTLPNVYAPPQVPVDDEVSYSDLLLRSSPSGIITYRADGQALSANDAVARIIGATVEDVCSQNFRKLESWKRSGLLDAADRALTTGAPQELEVDHLSTFGRKVHLWARFIPFQHAGEPHLLALFEDAGAKRQMAQAMAQKAQLQEQLAALAVSVPGILYSFRLRPDGTTSMPYASGALEPLFALSLDEVREDATPVFALIHPEDVEKVKAAMVESARTLGVFRTAFRARRNDGAEMWIEANAVPRRELDDSVLWHGFIHDVTEQKQLEAQLRQAQKMESIGQLAGGVAHDFNNLLTVISGHSTLISMGDELSEQARDSVQEISIAAERAANLTRQLLAFSRRQVIQSRPLCINEVVAGITKMLVRVVGEHNAVRFEPADTPPIVADPGMLDQLLMNLVVNARDAMPRGGVLTIRTGSGRIDPREVPEAGNGVFVWLTVTDTGCGIAPEHMDKIFEPFFTTKEAGKGTGLGLATVYGIVKQHNGWITVDSALGQGTTFKVYFPAAPCEMVKNGNNLSMGPIVGGDESILLVEDDASVRRLTREILEAYGYRVTEAACAKAALEAWERMAGSVDLLVTDIVMPDGMLGWELAEELRARDRRVKVVLMSGYIAEVSGAGVPLGGTAEFVQKPFSARDLTNAIRHCLDRRMDKQSPSEVGCTG